ncbi:MAG: hypothetical protein ACUVTL_07600 [Thermoproteota archaeon]
MAYISASTTAKRRGSLKKILILMHSYSSVNADEIYNRKDGWALKDPFMKYMPSTTKGGKYARNSLRPYVLVTVRSPLRLLHDELTSLSPALRRGIEDYAEFFYTISDDAKAKSIVDGDKVMVLSICVYLRIVLDPSVNRGLVKIFIHSENLLVNRFVPLDYSSITFTLNYKSIYEGDISEHKAEKREWFTW